MPAIEQMRKQTKSRMFLPNVDVVNSTRAILAISLRRVSIVRRVHIDGGPSHLGYPRLGYLPRICHTAKKGLQSMRGTSLRGRGTGGRRPMARRGAGDGPGGEDTEVGLVCGALLRRLRVNRTSRWHGFGMRVC